MLEVILKDGFHKEEGPFVKALERALASFNVQRQAYIGDKAWAECVVAIDEANRRLNRKSRLPVPTL